MGIIGKVLAWRTRSQPRFEMTHEPATLDARIGAAEYELRQISRDVHAVLLDQSRTKALTRVNFTV